MDSLTSIRPSTLPKNPVDRAAIMTSRFFDQISSNLHRFSNKDMISVRFDNFVVASVYSHPMSSSIPEELTDLIDWCKINSLKLVLGGNFNVHRLAIAWGSLKCTPKGHALFYLINEKKIILLNTGNNPTWSNLGLRSVMIDISLCSSNIFADISGWTVSDEAMRV